jgi:hypothetical protein
MTNKLILLSGQCDKNQLFGNQNTLFNNKCIAGVRVRYYFSNPLNTSHMKLKFILFITVLAFFSCKKDKGTCYECTVVSGANTYNETVCTDGDPQDELPNQDANGNLVWDCQER